MTPERETNLRSDLVSLIGRLDAKSSMDRAAIDKTIDDLLEAGREAGWTLPKPNSRR